MVFLKFLTIISLLIAISSCERIQNFRTALVGKTPTPVVSTTTLKVERPTKDFNNNSTVSPLSVAQTEQDNDSYLKEKINKVVACNTIELGSIDINNFVFTPEIEQCLSQSNEFYNYLLFLYKHNAKTANKRLASFMENNTKKSLSLESVIEIANKRLLVWLNRTSEVQEPKVEKPIFNLPSQEVVLEKNEFETTQAFKARVQNAQAKIAQSVEKAKQGYDGAVKEYNRIQTSYNYDITLEKKQRKSEAKAIYLDFISEEVKIILGEPYLQEDLDYDADKGIFYATLLSTNSDWREEISIAVPIAAAKSFKENIGEITPILGFDINNQGELFISYLVVRFDFQNYEAKLEKRPKKTEVFKKVLKVEAGSILIK